MNAPMRNRGRRYGGDRQARTGAGGPLTWFAGLFHKMLDRLDAGMALGQLECTTPDGTTRLLGGRTAGHSAQVTIHSWRALTRLAWGGTVGWYEAWARGEWSSTDPVMLFALFSANRRTLGGHTRATGLVLGAKRLAHWLRRNDRGGSRRNIAYHYDLGNDFYSLWLDPGMTYSSALFGAPDMTLADAQQAKLGAILARTDTRPGETILEIGCGWGSFAETAARAGVKVHGITLSTEQKRHVETRMAEAGLTGVSVSLTDYRDVTGTYDAVASIEMVEAVGQAYWPDYLAAIARALKPGGKAAIQLISIDDAVFDAYAANVDFIQAYVFPGGLCISERQFAAIAEAHGLRGEDRKGFGLDYAETLRIWRARFDAVVADRRLPSEFDENFVELWRYYLMYCEGGFRGGGIDVVQVTLVKD
jgi:cyclopropane-fatty-acyl-phospholipid synthase